MTLESKEPILPEPTEAQAPLSMTSSPAPSEYKLWGLAFAITGLFLLSTFFREHWVLDDALIFQNFVRNISTGMGWGYSPGHSVEGYSSPLWVLLLSALAWLGFPGFLVAKNVGTCLGAGMIFCCTLYFLRWMGLFRGMMLALALALQPGLAWWAASGMETSLYGFLLTFYVLQLCHRRLLPAAGLFGLVALTRPEGLMFGLPLLILYLKQTQTSVRQKAAAWVLGLGPFVLWTCFRLLQYKAFLANSALAKVGKSPVLFAQNSGWQGIEYLLFGFFSYAGLWLFVGLFLFQKSPIPENEELRTMGISLLCTSLLFVVVVKGDWMPWYRFLWPILPGLCLFAAVLCASSRESLIPRSTFSLLLGFALFFSIAQQVREWHPQYAYHFPSNQMLQARLPVARRPFLDPLPVDWGAAFYLRHILRYTKPGEYVYHVDIGQSGYFAYDIHLIDGFGLVSREECLYLHNQRTPQQLRARFLKANPSVVFGLLTKHKRKPVMATMEPILDLLAKHYTAVGKSGWWGGHTMYVFVRKDAIGRKTELMRWERWKRRAVGLILSNQHR